MKISEEEVFDLCVRLAEGEITKTQFSFWLNKWNVSSEEALAIFKRRLRKAFWNMILRGLAIAATLWFLTQAIVNFAR